jgi:hypothetical protein
LILKVSIGSTAASVLVFLFISLLHFSANYLRGHTKPL